MIYMIEGMWDVFLSQQIVVIWNREYAIWTEISQSWGASLSIYETFPQGTVTVGLCNVFQQSRFILQSDLRWIFTGERQVPITAKETSIDDTVILDQVIFWSRWFIHGSRANLYIQTVSMIPLERPSLHRGHSIYSPTFILWQLDLNLHPPIHPSL